MSRFGSLLSGGAPRQADSTPPAAAAPGLIEVVGYLDSVRVFGSWAIGSLWTESRETLKITGEMVKDLEEGQQYKLSGRMKSHPKYGDSLDVVSFAPHVKLDPRAIAKFMVNNFDGIGPKSAEKMVKHAMANGGQDGLEALRKQLLNEPWNIDWSPVKREASFNAEKEETTAAFIQRDFTTRLGNIPGMTAPVLKLLSRWALVQRATVDEESKTRDPIADCWHILTHNPYDAIRDVPGYGFLLADAIGRMVNIPLDSPQRLCALVAHALARGCDMEGHVYLTESQFVSAVQQVDRVIDARRAIEFGLGEGTIVMDDERGDRRFYTPKLLEAEDAVVGAVHKMMVDETSLLTDVRGIEDKIQAAFRQGKQNASSLALDPSQVAAVRGVLTSKSRIHVITGGPGCGKTALVETMIKMLPGRTFHFGAPTGKAAKVLSSRIHVTGHHASTIHSLLKGSEGGWMVNAEDPLEGDVLVLDEGSMPALELYKAILDACNKNMHLIVVGDPNQLQSIQPGRVLSDLISIPGINHAHLSTVHRNGGGILKIINEIAAGQIAPVDDYPDVTFSHGLGDAESYFPVVMQAYLNAVGRRGVENVILMMSRRQGKADEPGWNTTYANAVLRDTMNPNAEKLPGSASLHVGDRIIIRENMSIKQKGHEEDDEGDEHTVRVVNGDTGQILSYERYPAGNKENGVKWLRIKLDDGRGIDYPGEAIKALDHAYALTVHAAQGSEYAEVLGVFTPGVPSFVNRSSLFTAGSRPRAHMHYFAEDHVLRKIAATPVPKRNSALVEKVVELLGQRDNEDDVADAVPVKSRFRMAA